MYGDRSSKGKIFLLIDWRKAFDAVPQKLLLKWIHEEMIEKGEDLKFIQAIGSFKLVWRFQNKTRKGTNRGAKRSLARELPFSSIIY